MEKKKIYGDDLKQHLLAASRDRMFKFILAGDSIRGVILNGTHMVREMRANHELGILETLVLGRAYLGAALMSGSLKGQDKVSVQIQCSGPIKGLVAEANALGEVRGYLQQVPIPLERPMESFDLSPFFGAGVLSVTRYLQDAKNPFKGQVALQYGNIAQDLAHYYLTSEQIPTAFNLSIKFDTEGVVTGAGGLFLQAMPQAESQVIEDLESRVPALPSLGDLFEAKSDPEEFILEQFKIHRPRMMDSQRVEFICHCTRERLEQLLLMIQAEELEDIRKNGPFPLEVRCHYCNTTYSFDRADIERIYGKRFSHH